MPPRQDAPPASQTLSRGIRLLEELADARTPLTIDDLAARVELHRSVAYRLLRTLEDHGLVTRDAAGAVRLGTGLAALAAGVAADLQAEGHRPSLRLLPVLLAAERGQVEVVVAVVELLDAATVGGVGVEDLVADPQERADARHPLVAHALRPPVSYTHLTLPTIYPV